MSAASETRHPRYPWVPLTAEAKRRGENPDVFRRWLQNVNEAAGGTVLRSFSKTGKTGKLFVNVKALDLHAGPNASERDAALQQLAGRIEELEIEAMKNRAFRRRALQWFKRNGITTFDDS